MKADIVSGLKLEESPMRHNKMTSGAALSISTTTVGAANAHAVSAEITTDHTRRPAASIDENGAIDAG